VNIINISIKLKITGLEGKWHTLDGAEQLKMIGQKRHREP
jgi:hypothetical protein